MTAEQAVAQYYDAWRTRRGDMSGVPLAADFHFLGPVASFETAEGYRRDGPPGGADRDELRGPPSVREWQYRVLDRGLGDGDAGPGPDDRGGAAGGGGRRDRAAAS